MLLCVIDEYRMDVDLIIAFLIQYDILREISILLNYMLWNNEREMFLCVFLN